MCVCVWGGGSGGIGNRVSYTQGRRYTQESDEVKNRFRREDTKGGRDKAKKQR